MAACGFNSSSYFCKVFRETLGMTPQSFRMGITERGCRTNWTAPRQVDNQKNKFSAISFLMAADCRQSGLGNDSSQVHFFYATVLDMFEKFYDLLMKYAFPREYELLHG